jgi:hypothetical protein
MSKHTPSPWYIGSMNDLRYIINEPPRPSNDYINTNLKTKAIARLGFEDVSPEEEEANARLIKTSPRLLEACQQFIAAMGSASSAAEWHNRLEATETFAREVVAEATEGQS